MRGKGVREITPEERRENRRKAAQRIHPKAIDMDSRICFGIVWFATEDDANAYAADVTARGVTYNGGWMDGVPCGRDRSWDRKDEDGNVIAFAVTD